MSWDILSKVQCNHYVSSISYPLAECPRCRGHGVYFDIHPNALGRIPLVTGSAKLTQQIEKIFLEKRRPSGWGFNHDIFVGQYDAGTIRVLLRSEVISALAFLKQQQLALIKSGVHLNDNEIIDRAGDLMVSQVPSEPRRWDVHFKVVTLARQEVTIAVPFQLNTIPV